MSDCFFSDLTTVYTFDPSSGELSSKSMRLLNSSDSTSLAPVFTPGIPDIPVLHKDTPGVERFAVDSGRPVYFVKTPTEETSPEQTIACQRAVCKAKKMGYAMERMARQVELELADDLASPSET